MDVSDIHWRDQSIILKPKAKRSNKIVFFDDETDYILKRWLEIRQARNPTSDALWISTWGKRIGYGSIQYNINQAAVRCGLHDPISDRMEDHFSAHCCRHWNNTHLIRAGMPELYVMWLRGDSMTRAIDRYIHINPEDVRRSYLAHIPRLGV
jgi:integrase/recombinase XerD